MVESVDGAPHLAPDDGLGYALRLAGAFGAILPVRPGSKVPDSPHGHLDATKDPEAIARIVARGAWGVRPDPGYLVVDVDDVQRFTEALAGFVMPGTLVVQTGG